MLHKLTSKELCNLVAKTFGCLHKVLGSNSCNSCIWILIPGGVYNAYFGVCVYIWCKEGISGTHQPTILSHNNVLTRGTIGMLLRDNIMLPCGNTPIVPRVNIKWCHVSSDWLVKNHFYWLCFTSNIWPLVKGYSSKTSIKSTTLQLVKKTILVVMNLLKSTCPKN
jgi:hypothetical protein